jgi:hypothetical protein
MVATYHQAEDSRYKINDYLNMFSTVIPKFNAPTDCRGFMVSWEESCRRSLGDNLYPIVESHLTIGRDTMIECNLWTPNMTAGKVVGMMLDGLSLDELTRACSDSPYLAEVMVDACEVLMVAAGCQPFCA